VETKASDSQPDNNKALEIVQPKSLPSRMKESISRRDFIKIISLMGAGLAFFKSIPAFAAGMATAGTTKLGDAPPQPSILPRPKGPKWLAPRHNPRSKPGLGDRVREFDMEVTIAEHEIVPKIVVHAFTFNGTLPGPEIRVKEGEWVKVNLTNRTKEFHTIHWHGIQVPCEMDGVPLGTQWPVGPGETFTYLFRAQPAGTHFYHCHVMTPLHIQAGLFGALIIEPQDDPVRYVFPYDRDYTLILSEIDTNYVRDEMNRMLKEMGLMSRMSRSPGLMAEMNGLMMGQFKDRNEFLKAVKRGYIPPYVPAKHGAPLVSNPNFFMINGKSYPMTEEIKIRQGETIRVRLIGAGVDPHFMHLHGHDFWHVCQDGSPLPDPVRLNTVPVYPGTTTDIIIQGTNPGHWHFHDHSDKATTNNGHFPGGMMTMLMYEDAHDAGFKFHPVVAVDS
jgi:FtsP/CotA-like multicopper oxidase with cupredoxin domain